MEIQPSSGSFLPQTMPSRPSDRRSDPLSDPPQTRATPLPSPSTITTAPATCQSTPSLFLRSPSTPRRSASRFQTRTDLPRQQPAPAAGPNPEPPSMTAPHTGCCPMDTARLRYTPAGRAPTARSTLSPSHVTLYRSTRMKSLCEHMEEKPPEGHVSRGQWTECRAAPTLPGPRALPPGAKGSTFLL